MAFNKFNIKSLDNVRILGLNNISLLNRVQKYTLLSFTYKRQQPNSSDFNIPDLGFFNTI